MKTVGKKIFLTEFSDITLLKLTAFFHDVGKIGGVFNHQKTGADIFKKSISSELSLGKKATDFVSRIILHHLDITGLYYMKKENKSIDEELNFFWYRNKDIAPYLFILTYADILGTSEDEEFLKEIKLFVIYMQDYYFDEYREKIVEEPLLSGKEIMDILGIEPSPLVGEIKDKLMREQIYGRIKTKEEAERFIKSITV
ncbi:HD domain-containing protein [Persephonella sp.]